MLEFLLNHHRYIVIVLIPQKFGDWAKPIGGGALASQDPMLATVLVCILNLHIDVIKFENMPY